ncbi:hypothetical protein OGAPHI_001547 [Ogataea philodendri]|uniref:Uncharacterized protein n=1 Tax=Ogataea philodendri TaxID=1378263 RepID=A0A9P8T8X1_9ASCO|nr:uncharacterized protein OGAPHI_001547 [Ogataea philodendri]KAH3669426.1 hypothetical protein OGAPHI_001547 [Ogataea philodendri]
MNLALRNLSSRLWSMLETSSKHSSWTSSLRISTLESKIAANRLPTKSKLLTLSSHSYVANGRLISGPSSLYASTCLSPNTVNTPELYAISLTFVGPTSTVCLRRGDESRSVQTLITLWSGT